MADSIDQTQHVIYDDTAALGGVIRTLDNPLGKLLMSNTLGKAYYYMGRNLSFSNQIAEAADCYIEADRLQIDDYVFRGRINSCLGSICVHNGNDTLALTFYNRATNAFAKSNNEWRYAQALLNESEFNIKLHHYEQADSLLQIAHSFQLDNAYQARYYETMGLYFYERQQYDSALHYFNQGLILWETENAKSFSYMKIMQIYSQSDMVLSALPYAQKVIHYSNRPGYLVNAYCCLIQYAASVEDLETLEQYAHNRADCNRALIDDAVMYAKATEIIQKHATNPYPWRWVWILFISTLCVCLLCLISALIFRKHAQTARNAVEDIATHMHLQEEQLLENQFLLDCNTITSSIIDKYHTPHKRWRKYRMLKNDVDPWLHDWIGKLDALPLSEQEKIFCTISLIYSHLTDVDIANYMCYTKDSIRIIKNRILKKLGISSSEFTKFLRDLFLET